MDSLAFGKAIADPTRQKIMQLLCCDWFSVGQIVEKLEGSLSQPTVSHHLAVLDEAGLLMRRRKGKQIYCTLNQEAVAICCGKITQIFAPEVGKAKE